MSFANAGKSWSRAGLRAYLATLERPAWLKGVTFHHTAEPSLGHKAWANGWNPTLIDNMRDGYARKGWNRGPHFYPDDDLIWGLTPPTVQGIHAVAFNRSHIGIEVLGDYDTENHLIGRGEKCWHNAFACAAEVLKWAGLTANDFNFHRDDPNTKKTCPGKRITREWVRLWLLEAMSGDQPAEKQPEPVRMVVISEWLAAQGWKHSITKNDEGQVIVGGAWIESAYYDKEKQATLADAAELERDLLWKK